jgi:hypothetical protein
MVGCFGVGNQNTVPGKPFAENPVAHLTNLHFTFPFPMQQVLPFMARPNWPATFPLTQRAEEAALRLWPWGSSQDRLCRVRGCS